MLSNKIKKRIERIRSEETRNLGKLNKLRTEKNADIVDQEIKNSQEIIRYCDEILASLVIEDRKKQLERLEKIKEIIMFSSPVLVELFMKILKYFFEHG